MAQQELRDIAWEPISNHQQHSSGITSWPNHMSRKQVGNVQPTIIWEGKTGNCCVKAESIYYAVEQGQTEEQFHTQTQSPSVESIQAPAFLLLLSQLLISPSSSELLYIGGLNSWVLVKLMIATSFPIPDPLLKSTLAIFPMLRTLTICPLLKSPVAM